MNKLLVLISLIVLAGFSACKEKDKGIDYTNDIITNGKGVEHKNGTLYLDTTYMVTGLPASFAKMILIEDFSGVKCSNCPDAAQKIKSIEEANPGKVADVVMYASIDGSLSDSFKGSSKSSFRTLDANNLRTILGGPKVLPEVAVNRKHFTGEDRIVFDRDNLTSHFNSEAGLQAPVKVEFTSKRYVSDSNKVRVTISVQYGSSVADSDYLSVALTESKLVDSQDSNGVEIKNYSHENVLRKYMYPQNGVRLSAPLAGKVYTISFNYIIPKEWNPDNMKIVAILHKQNSATSNFYVSQVNETTVK